MVLIMAKKKEEWNDYLERQKEIDMIEESKKAEQEKIEKKKAGNRTYSSISIAFVFYFDSDFGVINARVYKNI